MPKEFLTLRKVRVIDDNIGFDLEIDVAPPSPLRG